MKRQPGRTSRCCLPVEFARTWIYYLDATNSSVLSMEMWLNGLAPFSRAHELGEVDDLFEAAALGELEETGDGRTPIKPIRTNPDVYELRRKALSKQLRFYHAEPGQLPDALVALHKHIKQANTQQSEIEIAVQRYKDGRAHLWREP